MTAAQITRVEYDNQIVGCWLDSTDPESRFRICPAAFTLVELLVAISIIALLVALLLPAAKKAKEHTRIIKCASNIRQVIMAMPSYAAENAAMGPAYWEDELTAPSTVGAADTPTGGTGRTAARPSDVTRIRES